MRDSSAHAWVEVWYDGIGWVQYEATPTYYSDMYEYRTSDPVPVTPIGPSGDDESDEDDITLTDEEIAANLGEIFCGMIYILHGSFVQSMSRTPAQKGTPEVNLYWRDYPDLRSAEKNPEEE